MRKERAKPGDFIIYRCDDCPEVRVVWTVEDVLMKGHPVCPNCDGDMCWIWNEKLPREA